MDLNYRGSTFTWARGVNTQSYKAARLYLALGNSEWMLRFPDAMLEHLPMIDSNHTPLLLNTNPGENYGGRKKFRFNAAWTTHHKFLEQVQDVWEAKGELGLNNMRMAEALSNWNKVTFGNIFQRKKRLLARIGGIQRFLAQHVRSDLIKLDRKLRRELEVTLHQE